MTIYLLWATVWHGNSGYPSVIAAYASREAAEAERAQPRQGQAWVQAIEVQE